MTEQAIGERQLCTRRMVGIDTFDLEAADRAPIVAASDDGCDRRKNAGRAAANKQQRIQGEERWRQYGAS
jgi:hypothetical protein